MNEKIPSQFESDPLKEEVRQMYEKDQEMRQQALHNDGIVETEEDETLDVRNTERMKEIIEKVGWPTISQVGPEVSNMAWLLVQHADHDVKFQKQCLELMRKLPEGEISKRNIAYLEDRIRVNEKRLQLYGTQFYEDEQGTYGPRPIEKPEKVDERRADMGMESLDEYAKILREKYKK